MEEKNSILSIVGEINEIIYVWHVEQSALHKCYLISYSHIIIIFYLPNIFNTDHSIHQ